MATQTLFLFLFLSVVHAQNDCPPSYCYGNGLAIRSPFWLQGQPLHKKCSFPGFDLSCIDRKTYLNILYSGNFYVDSIYYNSKLIQLSDPKNCLPRRLLSLNLSSYPFMADGYKNYTFFSCPKAQVSSIEVIDCLSNSSTAIVATKYQDFYFKEFPMCQKILMVPVPARVPFLSKYEFPVTIDLTWIAPDGEDLLCFLLFSMYPSYMPVIINLAGLAGAGPSAGAGVAHDRTIAFLLLAHAVTVLILFISCCVCMRRRDNHVSSYSGTQTTRGLDESTIETFKKMTIRENRRIPGSNDITCAVCLEDYVLNDTLRFMPECEHCFHVECIDKWLRTNKRCPICRVDLQAHNISPC